MYIYITLMVEKFITSELKWSQITHTHIHTHIHTHSNTEMTSLFEYVKKISAFQKGLMTAFWTKS